MEIDLTEFELFISFAEFEQEGLYIDLHNDYSCKSIDFLNSARQLKLLFKPNEHCKSKTDCVELFFEDCSVEQYKVKFDGHYTEFCTVDSMYRGRFETNNGNLKEVADNGHHYYYLDFLPNLSIELFAREAKANVKII